jgi:monothiol glutaredoxin
VINEDTRSHTEPGYTKQIQDVIENSDVAIFMKGTPDAIMCGNSERALGALRRAGAPITAVDILRDMQIRQDLSALSGWPTIPQVFVKGELIGGADIVEDMERSGELEQSLVALTLPGASVTRLVKGALRSSWLGPPLPSLRVPDVPGPPFSGGSSGSTTI